MNRIKAKDIEVVVCEPVVDGKLFFGSRVLRDIDTFKAVAGLIVANRLADHTANIAHKAFSRDQFGSEKATGALSARRSIPRPQTR